MMDVDTQDCCLFCSIRFDNKKNRGKAVERTPTKAAITISPDLIDFIVNNLIIEDKNLKDLLEMSRMHSFTITSSNPANPKVSQCCHTCHSFFLYLNKKLKCSRKTSSNSNRGSVAPRQITTLSCDL